LILGAVLLASPGNLLAKERAKGTLTYKGSKKTFTVSLNHAYLVKGPDMFDEKKTVRRLVLSPGDFSSPITSAEALGGFDGEFKEGIIIELADGPRYNYWAVFNDQLVQDSGSFELDELKTTANTADHLAGKVHFDRSKAGGAKLDVEFDAALLKSFSKAR